MNIPPLLLLIVGIIFGTAYAAIITFGWAKTRKNRKKVQEELGITRIPIWDLTTYHAITEVYVKSVSLNNNIFLNKCGERLNPLDYNVYIAKNSSASYPAVKEGDLIFIDKDDYKIKYAFTIPNLKVYR